MEEEPLLWEENTRVEEALAREIECLRKLKTKALQARYQELFGEETRSSNGAHLFRRICGSSKPAHQQNHGFAPSRISIAEHVTADPDSGRRNVT